MNDEGKLVIEEPEEAKANATDANATIADQLAAEKKAAPRGAKRQRRDLHPAAAKYKQSGSVFKAKKGGGDVSKNGLDPFAYLPLDSRFMSKKKGRAASKGLKAVLEGTKKGAAGAAKGKGRRRR